MQCNLLALKILKNRIVRACRKINPQILRRVRSAILKRLYFVKGWKGVTSSTCYKNMIDIL